MNTFAIFVILNLPYSYELGITEIQLKTIEVCKDNGVTNLHPFITDVVDTIVPNCNTLVETQVLN